MHHIALYLKKTSLIFWVTNNLDLKLFTLQTIRLFFFFGLFVLIPDTPVSISPSAKVVDTFSFKVKILTRGLS